MFAVEESVSDVATAAVGDVKAAFPQLIPTLQNPNSEAGKKNGKPERPLLHKAESNDQCQSPTISQAEGWTFWLIQRHPMNQQ